jgi:hypothetical protein
MKFQGKAKSEVDDAKYTSDLTGKSTGKGNLMKEHNFTELVDHRR